MYGGYERMDPEYLALLEKQGKIENLLGAGGLALNAAGTVAQGIGAYQAWKQQQEQMREERRRYEETKAIEAEERRKRDKAESLNNLFRYGGYARESDQARRGQYAGYAARAGL